MLGKISLVTVLSLSVAALPIEQARAQDGLVGGIIGGAIANGQRKSQPRTQRVVRSSGVSTAQREQNRSVQTALNHFGWNVGSADGVLGRRSREDASQYQAFAGFAATGRLTDFERNILVTAHQRAIIGGPHLRHGRW